MVLSRYHEWNYSIRIESRALISSTGQKEWCHSSWSETTYKKTRKAKIAGLELAQQNGSV